MSYLIQTDTDSYRILGQKYRLPSKNVPCLIRGNCDVVTDRLVPLHRGERNVDKLGLGFDFCEREAGAGPDLRVDKSA